jgi:hypothetical protein
LPRCDGVFVNVTFHQTLPQSPLGPHHVTKLLASVEKTSS